MKLTNNTKYDSRTLRGIITAVHAFTARDLKKGKKKVGRYPHWKRLHVTFETTLRDPRPVSRCPNYRSVNALDDPNFTLWLPNAYDLKDAIKRVKQKADADLTELLDRRANVRDVGALIWHNFVHLYGFGHIHFPPGADKPGDINVARSFVWLEKQFGERVPLKQPKKKKPKTKADLQQKRYERVLVLEKTWTRRLKLSQTKLKKLRVKKRYYEKELQKNDNEASN
jgi:hypothetical protein